MWYHIAPTLSLFYSEITVQDSTSQQVFTSLLFVHIKMAERWNLRETRTDRGEAIATTILDQSLEMSDEVFLEI